jgi:hypothetical protein
MPAKKKRLIIGLISILIGLVEIFIIHMNTYVILYFAGDCLGISGRLVALALYILLIASGLLLILKKDFASILYRIFSISLLIESLITTLLFWDCISISDSFNNIAVALIIGLYTWDKKKNRFVC